MGFFNTPCAIGKSRMRSKARSGIAPRSVGVSSFGVLHSGKRQIAFSGLRLAVPLCDPVVGIDGRSCIRLPG